MKIKDRIMALNDGQRTVREIAEIVYGTPATQAQCAHVRVVIRQRKGRGMSENDEKYWQSGGRVAQREAYRAKYATGDRERARAAGREAYRRYRDQGMARQEAHYQSRSVYSATMVRTGDVSARIAAHDRALKRERGVTENA